MQRPFKSRLSNKLENNTIEMQLYWLLFGSFLKISPSSEIGTGVIMEREDTVSMLDKYILENLSVV